LSPQHALQYAPFENAEVCASAVTPRTTANDANANIFFMIQISFDAKGEPRPRAQFPRSRFMRFTSGEI
jgi:hypothetical protein